MSVAPQRDERIVGVLELTRAIRDALAAQFTGVWVRGEVSNCKRSPNGHLYFKLKEGKAAVLDCALWAREAGRLRFDLKEGLEVEAFGDVTVWEPRGNYQLSVKHLRPAGMGALLLQLEQLKQKLQAEGLFDAARKRPLPRYPRRIGVVTSPVGAAFRDVLKVLRARWPAIGVVIAPVPVQGPEAAIEIASAIRRFNRYGGVDLLIVGRGGGSIEDLWAFNEEAVVRAVAASRLPVISAVGHEVDWTLCDHAADVRAATPSNAAEMAVPDQQEIRSVLQHLRERAGHSVRRRLEHRRTQLVNLIGKYGFERLPGVVDDWRLRVAELDRRARRGLSESLGRCRLRFERLEKSYVLRDVPRRVRARHDEVRALAARLDGGAVRAVHDRRRHLSACADQLRALSPRLVLERGYCLARGENGTVVRSAAQLSIGERLRLEFGRGDADARVESVRPEGGA